MITKIYRQFDVADPRRRRSQRSILCEFVSHGVTIVLSFCKWGEEVPSSVNDCESRLCGGGARSSVTMPELAEVVSKWVTVC